jgi:hypothetical protein
LKDPQSRAASIVNDSVVNRQFTSGFIRCNNELTFTRLEHPMRPILALAALALSLIALAGCSYERHEHYRPPPPPRVEHRTVYVPAYRAHDYHGYGYRDCHRHDHYRRDCD